ncbi:MAG: L,D-transpeptidase [Verrucomicrobiales bacterium]
MMKILPLVLFLFTLPLLGNDGKPEDPETALRVQIFLDQKLFGPGFLDGKPGKFTTDALYAYNRSKGRSPGDWASVIAEAEQAVPQLYATAVVPTLASKFVDSSLSTKRTEQAKRKDMPYRSYLEFMAERYHTSETFLVELNGSKAWSAKPRTTLKVPNIDPFLIENVAHGRSHKEDPVLSARTLVLDTVNNRLFVYDPQEEAVLVKSGAVVVVEDEEETKALGGLVAVFPITPGKERFIHRGQWKMINCVELPTWRFDKSLLESGRRSTESLQIPPGPNSPVGIMWAGLSKSGIGIHGTSSPRTIGRSQSAGCYRLANWDVARLPTLVRPGATVLVR